MEHASSDAFPHKEKWVERENNLRGEGWSQAQTELKPVYERMISEAQAARTLNEQAKATLGGLTGRLNKLVSDGTIDGDSLMEAFRSVPDAWNALNAIGDKAQQQKFTEGQQAGYNEATFAWAEWVITEGAKEAGKPALAQRLVSRINAAKQGRDNPSAILMDFVKEVKSIAFEAGKKAGQGASAEDAKVSARDGKGPASAVGESTGGGKPTYAQILKMTPSQIEALPKGAMEEAIDEASK